MLITDNISFKSRNYEIRRADDIAREISKKFPMISSSKIGSFPKADLFTDGICKLHDRLEKTRLKSLKILNYYSHKLQNKDKILNFLNLIKQDKLGNCAEMTELAMIFTFLKNIKDTGIADIKNSADEHLDHVVLYVDNGKRPYIIDTWLGFADYLSNAIQRYKSEFRFLFPFEEAKTQDFVFEKYKFRCNARKILDKCSREDLSEIKKMLK